MSTVEKTESKSNNEILTIGINNHYEQTSKNEGIEASAFVKEIQKKRGDNELDRLKKLFNSVCASASNIKDEYIEYTQKVKKWKKEYEDEIYEISFVYNIALGDNLDVKIFRKDGKLICSSEWNGLKKVHLFEDDKFSNLVARLFNMYKVCEWHNDYSQDSYMKGVFNEDGSKKLHVPFCDGEGGYLYLEKKNYRKEVKFSSCGPVYPLGFWGVYEMFKEIACKNNEKE
ncbi:hypothetical protein H6A03_07205 [[Clostridium] spiroforme]|nr:hypothetical protein [Thomasclavelia spiroformis]MBM6879563.1 hypothetical protein [Thomasclavelia spiroformis]